MGRRLLWLTLAVLTASGCDIVRGPSPLNDPPYIESAGDVHFTDSKGNTLLSRAELALARDQRLDLPITATEPEEEELTLVVGPIPRGWSFDEEARVLHVVPDADQGGLTFELYLCAEDAHDPPAYDVRVLSISVW